jgi:polysaccharide biosynthesis transport protein
MDELSPYFIRRTRVPPPAQPLLLNEPVEGERPEVGFWDLWRVIRKRRKLIAIFFLALVATVAVGTLLMTPIYTSEATLLIEEKVPQVIDIRQVFSETIGSERHDYYTTQAEILRSSSLAAQVIEEQHLDNIKILTGEEKGGIAKQWSMVKEWIKTETPVRTILAWVKRDKTEISDPTETLRQLTSAYTKRLEIKPVDNTHLVKILFSAPDPDLSAQVANAHAHAYIRQTLKLRAQANEEAQRFLEENLVQLRARVEQSEAALSSYRRETGIISLGDKDNVVVERLTDLNRRLTEAEADRIALQAQVQQIRQRAYESLPAVLNNSLIQTLKQQLSRLEGDYANLSAEYNLAYPRLAQLKAQVDETRQRLEREIQSVVAGIESAFLAAAAKEKELRGKFAEQKSAALQLKDASVEYAILEREVDTNRQLHNSVLQRTKEMGVAAELRTSNIFIVDKAKPPLTPSQPKIALNLLLGVILGAMGGIAVAFLVEYLDKTVSRPEEIERYFRLSTLGIVPDFSITGKETEPRLVDVIEGNGSTNGAGPHSDASVLSYSSLSVGWESYRSLQTSILLSHGEEPPRVVLFTSGSRGEGKTATVINTAIVFAQMEARVLVIDADLRRSSCHRRLWQERAPGLTEHLTNQRTLGNVIKPTLTDNLFVITGGAVPPDPAKLVGSRKMYDVLSRLREQFDYIFIDSPPLIPVSDALRLSTMVDGVVLVVKAQATTRDVLKEACSRLHYAQATVLGVVLNQVDIKNGDYGYDQYYYAPASPAVS